MLSLGLPDVIPALELVDPLLPGPYVELALIYGPGVVCNAWRILLPTKVTRVGGRVRFGQTVQGDDLAVDSHNRVWQVHISEEPTLIADSMAGWVAGWVEGSAHCSIGTPWFVPDSVVWNRAQTHAMTALPPIDVATKLVDSLPECTLLSWDKGPVSVQAHVWWQTEAGNAWIVVTAVAASKTRAGWDLGLEIRTEGDAARVVKAVKQVMMSCGWVTIDQ